MPGIRWNTCRLILQTLMILSQNGLRPKPSEEGKVVPSSSSLPPMHFKSFYMRSAILIDNFQIIGGPKCCNFMRDGYRYRHLVENAFARLKQYQAVATRYGKLKRNYES